MIIKLLGQPIVALHEAEIAGMVDGVIIKGNKAGYIYHKCTGKHFVIPVEKAIIGKDAVMIRDMTAMALTSKNLKVLGSMMDIYSTKGKYLGYLYGIEVDDRYNVRYIHTENYRIEVSKAENYESVIIADVDESELEKNESEASVDEAAVSTEIAPNIKWNYDDLKPKDDCIEGTELSVVKAAHQDEEKVIIPDVDEKYAYLCGKKLLEGIEIGETFYDKDTIIDAEIIKYAISQNAIVKVIVNAEE